MQVCLEEYITGDTARTLPFASTSTKSDRLCPSSLRRTAQRMAMAVCRACQLGRTAVHRARPRLAEKCVPLTALGVHRRCIDRWLRANVHCPLRKTPERTPLNSSRAVRVVRAQPKAWYEHGSQ